MYSVGSQGLFLHLLQIVVFSVLSPPNAQNQLKMQSIGFVCQYKKVAMIATVRRGASIHPNQNSTLAYGAKHIPIQSIVKRGKRNMKRMKKIPWTSQKLIPADSNIIYPPLFLRYYHGFGGLSRIKSKSPAVLSSPVNPIYDINPIVPCLLIVPFLFALVAVVMSTAVITDIIGMLIWCRVKVLHRGLAVLTFHGVLFG